MVSCVAFAREHGYDGVIVENTKENGRWESVDDYIAFNPNQINSADAVTYDDNGNAVSLSQRFNQDTDDIRYSETTTSPDQIDFDSYMAGLDPSIAADTTDRANLKQFQGLVTSLNILNDQLEQQRGIHDGSTMTSD